ncbi:MAG: fibronectin type III domain-containing protein [Verrucomicrobia bacterium]|nr:fibronectin type III domain-containing protein [Verrucomicrobiota bacterium]
MSFLAPKVETGVATGDNTPGRTATQSPRQAVPLLLGRGRVAVQWVTPVLNWRYYGSERSRFAAFSIYGWLCYGPIDEVVNLIVNNKVYCTIGKHRADYPGSEYIDEVLTWEQRTERLRLWWGLENGGSRTAHLQSLINPTDAPDMVGKTFPYDLGIAAIAIDGMEAGRTDGQTPPLPKIELEVYRRSPAAYTFGYDARGTHPVGIVKDLLTLKRGGRGLPATMFDEADWTAKMQRMMDDGVATMKGVDLFMSLVAAEPKEVDQHVADVLAHFGGWLMERNGKLYLDWEPNDGSSLDETGLRVISEHHLADDDVDEDPGDLEALPSQVIVTGLDWTSNPPLAEASEAAPVPFAGRLTGGRREPETMNRPGFTSREQLKAYATMVAALRANPDATYTVPLLRQYAVHLDGITPLRPGDRFVLNLAGNGGRRVVVRITERSSEDAVKVIFKCRRERGTYPQPAQPVLDPRVDPTIDPPADLARYAFAQLPPDLSDAGDTLVTGLVERPTKSVAAYEVHLSPSNVWPGQVIASGLTRFAVGAVLQTNLASGYADVTVTVNATGGEFTDLRSQSALEQSDDQLLAWHAGEWFSVGTITPLGGGNYSMSLLRARLGSLPAAHAIGAVFFLLPRPDLVVLTHASFAEVEAGGVYNAGVATKWFKLRPTGAGALQGNLTAATALTLRDPTPDAVTDLSARTGTGKIVELRWSPVTTALVNEYHIYRATGPAFVDEAKIGEVDSTRFYDLGVVLGVPYRYRLKAVATDEPESGFSNAVTATPGVVSGGEVDATPPANPGAITLNTSGTYLADDGTVFAWVLLNVPALPARAVGQTIKRRRAGVGGAWEDVGQVFNAGATTLRQDDLTPGTSYDFALEAFTFSGVPSALVVGTGSPYLAPTKTAAPSAPTAVTYVGGANSTFNRPQVFQGSARAFMIRANWAAPVDKDVRGYEWAVSATDSDASADAADKFFVLETEAMIVSGTGGFSGYFRVRTVDHSGNRSAWAGGGTAMDATLFGQAAGSMSSQNSNAISTTGLTIGSGTRKVVARQPIYATINLVGGTAQETVDFSLSGYGFSTRPDSGWLQSADWDRLLIRYDIDDSTSTNAKLRVTMADGTNVPALSGLEVTGEFLEYD